MLHEDKELSVAAAESIICTFLDATETSDTMKRTRVHHIPAMLATLKFITKGMGGAAEWTLDKLHHEMAGVQEWSGLEAEEVREYLEQALEELRS